MEHLVLNAINIRESFHCMTKYILNKYIKKGKANDVNDFKSIGEAAWGFILSLYESEWDKLITNNKNQSFRHNVISQTPKHVQNMFNFNTTSNFHGYLALFVSKTPLVV